ncbi:MAG: heavy metal translocating P-type ATPase [bacterium]
MYCTKFILSLSFSILIITCMIHPIRQLLGSYSGACDLIIILLGVVVVLGLGWTFHYSFFLKLRTFHFNMDSLISLGSLIPFLYSIVLYSTKKPFHNYAEGASFIITFILLGKYMESRGSSRASGGLRSLSEFTVQKATLIQNGRERQVDVRDIELDSIVRVKAGEKVPLDGMIIEGGSHIDESMLTGESMPLFKEKSDQVFAATCVLDGTITIRVTKIHKETIFSKMIEMVAAAQESKAPIQHMVDKVSEVFVPVVMGAGCVTFVLWYFKYGWNISTALLPAVAVLVVACPCALALATPVAIMVASGRAVRDGIIVKDGEAFENSSTLTTIIFDKTGTLTEGRPEVIDFIPLVPEEEKILIHAVSLAKASYHPLSRAIVAYGESRTIEPVTLENIKEVNGKGIEGREQKGRTFLRLGNARFMTESNIKLDEDTIELSQALSSLGKTVIFMAVDKMVAGIFAVRDKPKPDAALAIEELKAMGKEIYIMSGDNKRTTAAIAKEIGIKNIIAEVLPHEKAQYIKAFQSEGKKVAFIGDGLNDALALEVANLGIAINTGYTLVIESGNMVLIEGTPSRVVTAIKLSLETFKVIKQNIFWAFIYNLVGIPMAILGILPPAFASLAMSLSSVSVVINSLRIKKFSL